jgi:hypothetical protein
MNDKQTTRRRFLVAALTFSGVASGLPGISFLRSSAAWAQSTEDDDDLAVMGHFAQRLFPHDGLAGSVYGEVIADVLATTAADPKTEGILSVAEAALNGANDQSWIELSEAEQIEAMTALQDEAFFTDIREMVRFRLYEHQGLWKHIGYPGSSKEHGGYKFRGFDDIDWLPEES